MNRKNFMQVHGADPQAWARKYGIEPLLGNCSECDAPTVTNIPFTSVNGELRGLMSPECGCGNKDTPFCLVADPRHGDLFNLPDLSGAKRAPKGAPCPGSKSGRHLFASGVCNHCGLSIINWMRQPRA